MENLLKFAVVQKVCINEWSQIMKSLMAFCLFLSQRLNGVSNYEKPREVTITLLRKHSEGVKLLREATHEHTKLLQHRHRLTQVFLPDSHPSSQR